jgi:hypothetical protein
MADQDVLTGPPVEKPEIEKANEAVKKATSALANANGQLMDAAGIWRSVLSINNAPGVRAAVADDKKKLTEAIAASKASLTEAEKAVKELEPGPVVNNGGRRRKTRKGKGGRKAKKGTRRHYNGLGGVREEGPSPQQTQ